MKKLKSILLICLPLILNIASFIIFTPIFMAGKEPSATEIRQAVNILGFVIMIIEVLAFLLILISLKKENSSLKTLLNYKKSDLKLYVKYFVIAILPTIFVGWLYCKAQISMGIETNVSKYSFNDLFIWLLLTPLIIPFLEESIWRGYCLSKYSKPIYGIILTSLSFALFHGIFNPIVLLSTFLQGIIWSLIFVKTKSIIPSYFLHFISRYLLFIPIFT